VIASGNRARRGLEVTGYRDNAVWLTHPTSAQKIAALTDASGNLIWAGAGPERPRWLRTLLYVTRVKSGSPGFLATVAARGRTRRRRLLGNPPVRPR
jgi:hypothetical protein